MNRYFSVRRLAWFVSIALVAAGLWHRWWNLGFDSKGDSKPLSGVLLIVGTVTRGNYPTGVWKYDLARDMISKVSLCPTDIGNLIGIKDIQVIDSSNTAILRPWDATLTLCSTKGTKVYDLSSESHELRYILGGIDKDRTVVLSSGGELAKLDIASGHLSTLKISGARVDRAVLGSGNTLIAGKRNSPSYSHCLVSVLDGQVIKTFPNVKGGDPALSHSGKRIAFYSGGLVVYDIVGSNWQRTLSIPNLECDRIRWSPDDSYLACESMKRTFFGLAGGARQLQVADAKTGEVRRIPMFSCTAWNWCPN